MGAVLSAHCHPGVRRGRRTRRTACRRVFVSGLGFLFLPPFNTLYVHDPKDWLSLLIFLLVGMAVGLQSGRLRDREAETLARERESLLLNRLSTGLVTIASTRTMAETLLDEIKRLPGRAAPHYGWPTLTVDSAGLLFDKLP